MANVYIKEIVLLFVAWIAYGRAASWLKWRKLKKWGADQGCEDVPVVPNKLPGGIERFAIVVYRMVSGGLKNLDFLEDIIRWRFNQMQANTYRLYNVSGSAIMTADPENIQAVLATKFLDYDLGPRRRDTFLEVLGDGIFTAERPAWAHYRAQLKPQFTRNQVSELDLAERHLQVLFDALPVANERGWVEDVDVLPFLYRFTLDVSTEFLFGQSVNTQSEMLRGDDGERVGGGEKEEEEEMSFSEAMNCVQEMISWRIRLNKLAYLMSQKRFYVACEVIKDYADQFVHLALSPTFKPSLPAPNNPKPKYVLLHDLATTVKDPIELRDQVLQILLAGRDTTSAMLGWTIALLSRHPESFNMLRAAVIEHFGTERNPKGDGKPTFENLKACKELTWVFYEILRLYPLLPINGRVAVRDTVLPRGGGKDGKSPMVVMKGEQVGYIAYVMHRRHDIWGENADEFVPARWEGRKLGWEWLGFSGGPRVCLGQQYALNEASFVMVKLLQRYDKIEAMDMKSEIKKSLTIILAPAPGAATVRMRRARD